MHYLEQDDPEIAELVRREAERIETTLNLIAAESHTPHSVMAALGSVFNEKTIEGYPGRRFHAGCIHADAVEELAVSRARALFGAEYANVQPHSGTSANLAVYFSLLKTADRVLAMSLPHGGHLSHGHSASITSRCFEFAHYPVDPETERIDYDRVRQIAETFHPRMIVAGASAYPRLIDYDRMAEIAAGVGAYLMADMAHIAGLVAADVIPSPVPRCDVVTFTCYKTLMGGRGGVILAKGAHGDSIDRTIFPGSQGTSPVNAIAAKAVTFRRAMAPDFRRIQAQTIANAQHLAAGLHARGFRIVTGGTENHQVIVDVGARGLSGDLAEKTLERVGIIANRNTIPSDAVTPPSVSGVRLGTGALAARGMGITEMGRVADMIAAALMDPEDRQRLESVASNVRRLCAGFPVYPGERYDT
ncbi:Serine hydroxymethyltransferase (EC [Olavius algarvensis associated proteobacterium Delta 3]|nr:Serine hydroxymethyltransferase (EC [Olavius algarvensis associated proteobacterium Delta 3]